jgi:hypothetical protein
VEGTYEGTATSTAGNPASDVVLTLNPLNKRKLSGTIQLTQSGEVVGQSGLKGTLSASGNVNLGGKLNGKKLVITGLFTPSSGEGSARTIEGTYKITGGRDQGTFSVSSP